MKLFVLCILVAVAAAKPKGFKQGRNGGKIVGGEEAEEGQFPHQLSLEFSGSHICGASIISENAVLTAAHCLVSTSHDQVTFRAGTITKEEGGKVYQAESIKLHPDYNAITSDKDFAIVHIAGTFELDDETEIIEMAETEPETGEIVTVSGWGHTEEGGQLAEVLMFVDVPVADRDLCNENYNGEITENMVCAGLEEGGIDSCQGDSGGPLIDEDGLLVGVVSFGIGCARPKFFGVYSNVAQQRQWILETAGIAGR